MSAMTARYGRICRTLLVFSICIALPAAADTITAPGMSGLGTITYDALGMPTIQASNDNDVAFLQGYAQAKARFFEMDFDRRAASGTLGELVGSGAPVSDVQARLGCAAPPGRPGRRSTMKAKDGSRPMPMA